MHALPPIEPAACAEQAFFVANYNVWHPGNKYAAVPYVPVTPAECVNYLTPRPVLGGNTVHTHWHGWAYRR